MTQTKTRDYIVIATITTIEKYGIQHVTTRLIAEEAGVNNAALHYYFGTKENLIAQALSLSLHHMMEDTDAILSTNEEYSERLKTLFLYLSDGVVKFPNLIRAHIIGPIMEGDPNGPFLDMLDAWLKRTTAEFETNLSDEVHQRLRMAFQSAISTLLFAGLIPEKQGVSTSIDLHEVASRDEMIKILVETIVRQLG
jgi:AcrR family transcriptional regulator